MLYRGPSYHTTARPYLRLQTLKACLQSMLFRHNLVKNHTRSFLNHKQENKIPKRAAVGAQGLDYRIFASGIKCGLAYVSTGKHLIVSFLKRLVIRIVAVT